MAKIKVSLVINTLNEEKNIVSVIRSVGDFADEVVVVDMESSDNTVSLAKQIGARVFTHPRIGYVEPARNFAIEKAKGDWIFILDADERANPRLLAKLKKLIRYEKPDYVLIPRKNIIFGKWIRNSRWWPDYNIRFFKKGAVVWKNEIHSEPERKGKGVTLLPKEKYAIVHRNYSSVSDYIQRMDIYSSIQAKEKVSSGYKFNFLDLLEKPAAEFFGRFFSGKGYKDGVHGLALALLQTFSELIIYLKVWQTEGFVDGEFDFKSLDKSLVKMEKDLNYWRADVKLKKTNRFLQSLILKIKRKFRLI